jgi:GNAT superfamily N-acetyltransferase
MKYRVRLKQDASASDRQVLFDLLEDYNASKVGPEPELPLAVLVQDEGTGSTLGGLWGLTYYRWLFIELMIVPAEMRSLGVGTQLMQEAEAEALLRGCHGIWLETFTFQARGFYEKLGFTVFSHIPEYPPGHKRWFMLKRLSNKTATPTP